MGKIIKFADMHCHSSFMTFLWKSKPRMTLRQKMMSKVRNRFAISLTNSASDIDKLINGEVKLISASLYAIERGFSELSMVRFFLFFMTNIDSKLLKRIRRQELGYNEQIRRNIAYIKKALQVNPNVQFRLIHEQKDFIEDEKVNVVLSLEGAHALFSNSNYEDLKKEEVWQNLSYLKNENSVRIFYLTLVHIQKNPFANHAFGIPQKALRHKDFTPNGNGISPFGFELIKRCLSEDDGRPILIDVKHLSVKSRFQYYEWRKANFPNVPIVASHMGVTGAVFNKSVVNTNFELKKDVFYIHHPIVCSSKGVKFNNWSINLYDEEIVEILNSGGIIGLSLDVGILGANKNQKEVFSKAELPWFETYASEALTNPVGYSVLQHEDIEYFINNLEHILKVAKANKCENVCSQLCIGSDFDGLIAPIKECLTVLGFKSFSSKLRALIEERIEDFPYLDNENLDIFIENLFYANFRDFTLKYV